MLTLEDLPKLKIFADNSNIKKLISLKLLKN